MTALTETLAKLPENCYALHIATQEIVILTRGKRGYTPTDYGVGTPAAVDSLNAGMGVSKAQHRAMLLGSFAGFEAPGADPDRYDEDGKPR